MIESFRFFLIWILIVLFTSIGLKAQDESSLSGTNGTAGIQGDPLDGTGTADQTDVSPGDTLGGEEAVPDSIPMIRQDFNHREQIITGSVIMSSLILIMAIMNNYNPRQL